jgi:hypothetical protein
LDNLADVVLIDNLSIGVNSKTVWSSPLAAEKANLGFGLIRHVPWIATI